MFSQLTVPVTMVSALASSLSAASVEVEIARTSTGSVVYAVKANVIPPVSPSTVASMYMLYVLPCSYPLAALEVMV